MANKNILPSFNNEISIVFATDDNYAIYLGVAIMSIIENVSNNLNYGIYILEETLNIKYKKLLSDLAKPNISINFINTKNILSEYPEEIFYTHSHFTKATYYRFFIPEIFKNFNKIIYLDCDLLVNDDIKNLFEINLENNCVAGVITAIYKDSEDIEYIDTLKLSDSYKYFNAGVLVFDINKLKEINFTERCINVLNTHRNLKLLDQDVLNIVLDNKTYFLDAEWNIPNSCLYESYIMKFNDKKQKEYLDLLKEKSHNFKILHYTWVKPWDNPEIINSHYFWKYARKTPFYEMIIYNFINSTINKPYKIAEDKLKKDFLQQESKSIRKNSILENIFSIKNEYSNNIKHKVITIFGIKLKFKTKK